MRKVTRYHYWNKNTKQHVGITLDKSNDVKNGGSYVHQAFEIEIPDFPEPEPEWADGLYLVIDAFNCRVTHVMHDGIWYNEKGSEREPKKIIGRIPVEPVEIIS